MKVKSGYARLILPWQKLLTKSSVCVCACLGFERTDFWPLILSRVLAAVSLTWLMSSCRACSVRMAWRKISYREGKIKEDRLQRKTMKQILAQVTLSDETGLMDQILKSHLLPCQQYQRYTVIRSLNLVSIFKTYKHFTWMSYFENLIITFQYSKFSKNI